MAMQCRMCSQRLTRPGRLCRECDRELARARSLTASTEGLAAMALPLDEDASQPEDRFTWTSRLASRPAAVAAAFVVGTMIAVALYAVEHARANSESVMIGRDLSAVQPIERPIAAARFDAAHASAGAQPAGSDAQGQGSDVASAERAAPTQRSAARTAERQTPVVLTTPVSNTQATTDASKDDASSTRVAVASVTSRHHYDRVLGLADALDTCAEQPLFSRIECEQRARGHFCNAPGGSEIPQCAERPLRDYGQ